MTTTTYRCGRCHNQAPVSIPTVTIPGTQAPVLLELARTVHCTACGTEMQPHTANAAP